MAWSCDKDAWKQTSPPPTLQCTPLRPTLGEVQKKLLKDHIKLSLSKCGILFTRLEELATDRDIWRVICDQGLTTFEQQHINVSEAKRMCRHQQRNPPYPTTMWQRLVCGRVCASAFGLRNHTRRHKRTR